MKVLYTIRAVEIFCAAALLLLCSASPFAGLPKNELSAHGGGGLSALSYTLPYGKYTAGFGSNLGLGYTRFVNRRTGISTGLSLSSYSAAAQLDGATLILPNQHDIYGDVYDLHTELLSYREQQHATFVHIPLMLSYYQNRRRNSLYAQVGLKLSIPLNASYKIRNATLRSEGYYHDEGYSMRDPYYMGFGLFDGHSAEGTLDLNMVYTAAVEMGLRWRLSDFVFYAGLFADYGLNNALRSSSGESLIRPNIAVPENFTMGSVLASSYTADNHVVDKLSLMSVGLKMRIAFGSSHQSYNFSISTQLRLQNWELQCFEDLLLVEQEAAKERKQKEKEAAKRQK